MSPPLEPQHFNIRKHHMSFHLLHLGTVRHKRPIMPIYIELAPRAPDSTHKATDIFAVLLFAVFLITEASRSTAGPTGTSTLDSNPAPATTRAKPLPASRKPLQSIQATAPGLGRAHLLQALIPAANAWPSPPVRSRRRREERKWPALRRFQHNVPTSCKLNEVD